MPIIGALLARLTGDAERLTVVRWTGLLGGLHEYEAGARVIDKGEIGTEMYMVVTGRVRVFDPATRLWAIYWADSRFPGPLDPPVVGSFDGDVGTFEGPDTFAGRPVLVRYTWSGVTTPSNSSPTRSAMNAALRQSISSRSASSARRSDWLDSSAISWSSSTVIGPPSGACDSR